MNMGYELRTMGKCLPEIFVTQKPTENEMFAPFPTHSLPSLYNTRRASVSSTLSAVVVPSARDRSMSLQPGTSAIKFFTKPISWEVCMYSMLLYIQCYVCTNTRLEGPYQH